MAQVRNRRLTLDHIPSKSNKKCKNNKSTKKRAKKKNRFKNMFSKKKKIKNDISNSHDSRAQNMQKTPPVISGRVSEEAPYQKKKLQKLTPSNSNSHTVEYTNCSATISTSLYNEPSNESIMGQLSLYRSVLSDNNSNSVTSSSISSDDTNLRSIKLFKPQSKSIQFDTFNILNNATYISDVTKSFDDDTKQTFLVSTTGFTAGYHEFNVRVMQSGFYSHEIGVVSNPHVIKNNKVEFNGIAGTRKFGARSVYGNELMTESLYYASYNDDGGTRCYKDLMLCPKYNQSWTSGDVIKVCLDLDRNRVTYYLNNKRVRKSVSLQVGKTYFPIISFVGNCRYSIVRISDSPHAAFCE